MYNPDVMSADFWRLHFGKIQTVMAPASSVQRLLSSTVLSGQLTAAVTV